MTSDFLPLIAGMRAWLAADDPLAFSTLGELHSTMFRFSRAVHVLLGEELPSERVLSRTAFLFDDLASQRLQDDWYGERYEIALALAFVGWKHSYLLGREIESLEWLRVTDCLANEESAELSRLEDFLYLSDGEKTPTLCQFFLGSGIDIFLSLAVLRRDRLRRPLQVTEAAIGVFQWLTGGALELDSKEAAFFRAEAAWLITAELRMLGRMTETRKWLAIAKRERRRMYVSDGVRARLQLTSLLLNRERHQYRHLGKRFRIVRDRCLSLGLYREALTCRYAAGVTEKVQGRLTAATLEFKDLFEETQNTIYGSIAGLSLGHLARNLAEQGLPDQAEADFARAIDLLKQTGDTINLGSLVLEIGDAQLSYDRPYQAAQLFEIAAEYYSRAGSGYWRAYAKLLTADALLDDGRPVEALEALAISFPLIKRESMCPEGVHALQILNRIASRSEVLREPISELIATMRDGIN